MTTDSRVVCPTFLNKQKTIVKTKCHDNRLQNRSLLAIEYNSLFTFCVVIPHLSLTIALTALQELAKEIQRQGLFKKIR
jgi:hypothetical protein